MKITDYLSKALTYCNERPKWVLTCVLLMVSNFIFWGATTSSYMEWYEVINRYLLDPLANDGIPEGDAVVYWSALLISFFIMYRLRDIDQTK